MSDIMRPMPFAQLMDWVLTEYKNQGSIFGVSKLVKHAGDKALPIFEEKIESPYGPAAGPHTQLAQNIIAAYAAGARFFELKTVQIHRAHRAPGLRGVCQSLVGLQAAGP